MITLKKILSQLGFSENESKVYITALEAGTESAQNIARQADIKRTTAYSVLEHLVERGFIGKTKISGKTRFIAEPPDKLLTIVNNLKESIENALPEFEAHYNKKGSKPKIMFYEGEQAIQNVYEDTLRERPEEILEWNTDNFFTKLPKEFEYIKRRVALGIKARRIAAKDSQWHTSNRHRDTQELAQTVIVPKEHFSPSIEVNIYNNKVAFMNFAEGVSVIIESKAIADAMRQAYHLSWRGAQQVAIR